MRHLKTLASALAIALALIAALDYAASAATGGTFLLGRTNKAAKPTTLKRTTAGPALSLTTSPGSAPLQVTGRGTVANLSADRVDGLDSSALRNHSYVYDFGLAEPVFQFRVGVPVPAGAYEFSYSTLFSGGGAYAGCELVRLHGATEVVVGTAESAPGVAATGAGVVVLRSGDSLVFKCSAEKAFTTPVNAPVQLVLTPTTVVPGPALVPIEAVVVPIER